jgi:hypothetical protein
MAPAETAPAASAALPATSAFPATATLPSTSAFPSTATLPATSAFPASAPTVAPPDRVLGLISLPQVFGMGPCDTFTPVPVGLFAEPDSSVVRGTIVVEVPWTFHDGGGCEGLSVKVRSPDAAAPLDLPTLEAGYEEPAAIVLEHRGSWFRIRLHEGSAWMHAGPDNAFLPLERLIEDGLTYVANPAGATLASAPGSPNEAGVRDPPGAPCAPGTPGTPDPPGAPRESHESRALETWDPVEVLETRWVEGDLWVRVAVLSHSVCDSLDEPTRIAEGWLPAHAPDGEPTIWFYSRGC